MLPKYYKVSEKWQRKRKKGESGFPVKDFVAVRR